MSEKEEVICTFQVVKLPDGGLAIRLVEPKKKKVNIPQKGAGRRLAARLKG